VAVLGRAPGRHLCQDYSLPTMARIDTSTFSVHSDGPAWGSYETARVWQNKTSDPTCASSCKPSALQKRVPPSCTERVADYVRVEVEYG